MSQEREKSGNIDQKGYLLLKKKSIHLKLLHKDHVLTLLKFE